MGRLTACGLGGSLSAGHIWRDEKTWRDGVCVVQNGNPPHPVCWDAAFHFCGYPRFRASERKRPKGSQGAERGRNGVGNVDGRVLHVISDQVRHRLPLAVALAEAAAGGADVVQVRQKRAPAQETWIFLQELRGELEIRGVRPSVFVNDRLDIAAAAGCDGAHLAAKSLPVGAAVQFRSQCRWRGRIGCSVHSLEEAVNAEREGADYIAFGHVYPTASHRGMAPRGLRALAEIVDALSLPVIAIGGIDPVNLREVLQTGCSGVAVIGAVLESSDPRRAAQMLKGRMEDLPGQPKVPFFQEVRRHDRDRER